jgi:hypothetical protein
VSTPSGLEVFGEGGRFLTVDARCAVQIESDVAIGLGLTVPLISTWTVTIRFNSSPLVILTRTVGSILSGPD